MEAPNWKRPMTLTLYSYCVRNGGWSLLALCICVRSDAKTVID